MPTKSKFLKRLLIIFAILFAIVTGSYFGLNYFLNKKLPKLLGDNVKVEEVSFDLLQRSIRFSHPSVFIDSANSESQIQIKTEAREVHILGFSVWELLTANKIEVENLVIDSVDFEVWLPKEKATQKEKKEINFFVKDIFTRIVVSHIELNDTHFLVKQNKGASTFLEVHGFCLTADQVLVDTSTINHLFPLEFSKSTINIDSIFMMAGPEHTLEANMLSIADTTLSIENVRFKSIYSKRAFVKAHKYEKARIDFSVNKLTSDRLLWNILDDSTVNIYSEKVNLEGMKLFVFKDKTPPIEPPMIKPLLSGMIKNLPFGLTIDTLTVRKGYIQFEQLPVVFPRSGKIFFDDVYMTAYHVTNDSAQIAQNPKTIMDMITNFMGKGKLAAVFKLDMSSPKQAFSVTGNLGAMPVTYINQVLAPLMGVEAEGQVERMDFEFTGDEYESRGKLIFEYTDLKITSYDKDRKKEWLKSTIGNLILNNKNKRNQKLTYKEGDIHFVRYQNKDFFNYLWNSLRTGLMEIVVPFYSNPDDGNEPDGNPKFQEDD